MDEALTPFTTPVWSVARGHQAECLNALGRPAEALKVCEAARALLSAEDRPYVFAYQQLERESAIALAGLRRFEEAASAMDGLIAECAGYDNPLVLGVLHCDRARIACMAGDREAFEQHAQAAASIFASTQNPALLARTKRLFDLGRRAGLVEDLTADEGKDPGSELIDKVRAARALNEIVEAVGAKAACLYLFFYGRAFLGAQLGDPTSFATGTLDSQVASIARDFGNFTDELDIETAVSRIDFRSNAKVIPLCTYEGGKRQVVGLLVLAECEKPGALDDLDLSEIAAELVGKDESTDVV